MKHGVYSLAMLLSVVSAYSMDTQSDQVAPASRQRSNSLIVSTKLKLVTYEGRPDATAEAELHNRIKGSPNASPRASYRLDRSSSGGTNKAASTPRASTPRGTSEIRVSKTNNPVSETFN